MHDFPLFPLDLVALPHELIPLHIFEERFKTMLNECLRAEWEFGIVSLSDDSLREIGCACAQRPRQAVPEQRVPASLHSWRAQPEPRDWVAAPARRLAATGPAHSSGQEQRGPSRSAAYYLNRMATDEPPPAPAKRGRLPRRPRHFAPYRLARFIVFVLALVGVVALALLVLGLLNVDVVTDHFDIR